MGHGVVREHMYEMEDDFLYYIGTLYTHVNFYLQNTKALLSRHFHYMPSHIVLDQLCMFL